MSVPTIMAGYDGSPIMAGYDGSPHSRVAAEWAAAEAARTGSELLVVHVYDFRVHAGVSGGSAVAAVARVREASEKSVADLVDDLRVTRPRIEVCGVTVPGYPVPTLLDLSAGTRLMVVGNRGAGGFANLLLGSVGEQIATHARVPVAVVRGRTDATEGPVLVGVDGSDASDTALGLAFGAAAERGTSVLAVRASMPPAAPGQPGNPLPAVHHEDLVAGAQTASDAVPDPALDAAVAPWRVAYPSVPVEERLVGGQPARTLAALSVGAQLVVVGSRGHGGFVGLLLGSVGQQLLQHAQCPVVVAHAQA